MENNSDYPDIDALVDRMDQRFARRLDLFEQRFRKHFREVFLTSESSILKAIYGYTALMEQRSTQFEATDAALAGRVSTLESRMLECERRLNIPPAS